ncbi:metal-nicotianamine transporter YSL14 [Spatholobus suberectus]|nr:metal-nicotianamine transporter YSL14 [Spatholobus suberectus]
MAMERIDKAKGDAFGPAIASGLVCEDGLWIPASILALARVKAPIYIKLLSRATNHRVDAFLGN